MNCFSRESRRTMQLTMPSNSRAFHLGMSRHTNHLPWPDQNRELHFLQIPKGLAAHTEVS